MNRGRIQTLRWAYFEIDEEVRAAVDPAFYDCGKRRDIGLALVGSWEGDTEGDPHCWRGVGDFSPYRADLGNLRGPVQLG